MTVGSTPPGRRARPCESGSIYRAPRRANELRNPTADQCICLSTVLTILKLEGVEAGHLGQALMTFFKVAGNCAMRKRTL